MEKMAGRAAKNGQKGKGKVTLKRAYYSYFLGLVVVPVLVVLAVALLVLNQVFRRQAVENIGRAQEAVTAELLSDMEQISMRLSHMVYANNSELLSLAADTDVEDRDRRYQSIQKLNEAASYATEPVKDIVSVAFYMKDGSQTYFKNDIRLPSETVRQERWYQAALAAPNRVVVGSYDTKTVELYSGGTRDSLVMAASLAPDVTLDRSQKIEMVSFFQVTGVSDKIRAYNTGYRQKKNKIGYTRIVDGEGTPVYQPQGIPEEVFSSGRYIRVASPLTFYGNDWQVESYVRPQELTADYWVVAAALLFAMLVVLVLYALFSRYFLRSIIRPVEEMSGGLKQVEDGMLDVHLTPSGQYELRTMVHSFNAMVRRLKALIADYEERVKCSGQAPADYLRALVRGDMAPGEVLKQAPDVFARRYLLFVILAGIRGGKGTGRRSRSRELAAGFDTIPRFASRCILDITAADRYVVFYRIEEDSYEDRFHTMIREIQKLGAAKEETDLSVCIGTPQTDLEKLPEQAEELLRCLDLCVLGGRQAVLDLGKSRERCERLTGLAPEYGRLAAALYIADEKTVTEERDGLLKTLQTEELADGQNRVLAVILATARQFSQADEDFCELFDEEVNYFEKIGRIGDVRSLRLWISNYISWVEEYSRNRLDVSQSGAVTRAKHYILEHYQNPDLTLGEVAAYVDLNEKYFTTKFTKECGETYLSYLTGLRVQKARELIRTTTFKMYEIAEMVGYSNPEHFNRVFKKVTGTSPAQYRKMP